MRKGLFTYTTKVEPQVTVSEIQDELVSHGAKSIMTNYTDGGEVESISFMIVVDGQPRGIRLPCDPNPVYKVLESQYRAGKIRRGFVDEHQALRVAWRIVFHWVEAQMAILETKMVKMEQIFLPYMVMPNGRSLFDNVSESKFKILGGKTETNKKDGAEEGEVMKIKEVEED